MRTISLGLTAEQRATRSGKIGGSDANTLMGGDVDRIHNLFLEKTGQKEPEDLSDILPVQMGSWTEELNCLWYERQTGFHVFDEGREVVSAEYPWRTATLDGLTNIRGTCCVFEAKHVNAFSKMEDVVQRYMPQLHHNMAVAGYHVAVLSVFKGTLDYAFFEIEEDPLYGIQVLEREIEFWKCVQTRTPPAGMEGVSAPVLPTELRTVDMTGNNQWASSAADWREHGDAAKKFEKAAKSIKALTEDDVEHAYGHGVQIKRAKNNSVRITKMKGNWNDRNHI